MTLHLHRSFMVTLCPYSGMGSLPRDAVLPKLILRGLSTGSSSSRTTPIWVLITASACQEQTAPARVPHGRQLPPDPLLLCGLLSTGCSSSPGPAPAEALHGLQPPPGHIHLLHRGLLNGLQRGDLLRRGTHGLQGDSLLHHRPLHGLQGNFSSGAWSPSCPPSALT